MIRRHSSTLEAVESRGSAVEIAAPRKSSNPNQKVNEDYISGRWLARPPRWPGWSPRVDVSVRAGRLKITRRAIARRGRQALVESA